MITYSEAITIEECEAQDAAIEAALCNTFPHLTQSSVGWEPVRLPETPTATRFATNHDWNRRNSGRKSRSSK